MSLQLIVYGLTAAGLMGGITLATICALCAKAE